MKTYTITLWRYPALNRDQNAVGVSVFYYTEIASSKGNAIKQAKKKFEHSVWTSHAVEN